MLAVFAFLAFRIVIQIAKANTATAAANAIANSDSVRNKIDSEPIRTSIVSG